ncbi:hypothetical protein FB451DRAFT_95543 [Mycena latifolia]|nr:hypothetical protein FB451DRAFT_95543 [Mycena latifolia]
MTGLANDEKQPLLEKDAVEDEDHDAKTLEPVDPDPAATPPRPPAFSWRTRILYLLLMVAVLWLVLQKTGPKPKPKVVYANRYSNEFKFRPAASPIITETLKDGRKRVRGAAPTTSKPPLPKPTKSKTKKGKTRSGKKKQAIGKKVKGKGK